MSAADEVREWTRRFERGVDNGLRDIALSIIEEAKPIIAQEAVDNGDLLESGGVIRISSTHYQAAWSADHAPYINYGTRPHWPPFEPIYEWVLRNVRIMESITIPDESDVGEGMLEGDTVSFDGPEYVIKPKRSTGTRKMRKGKDGAQNPAAARIANAIRAKIAKKGTEPVLYAERARDRVATYQNDLMIDAVNRSLARA